MKFIYKAHGDTLYVNAPNKDEADKAFEEFLYMNPDECGATCEQVSKFPDYIKPVDVLFPGK